MAQALADFDEAVKQVGKNTVGGLFPLWMENWAHNLEEARKGDSLDKLYSRPASERVLLVGRGPSIFKHDHLDLLAKHPFNGHIVASDGALPLLAERGITPYVSVTVDGSDKIAKWFTGASAGIKVKAVLPLTVHPKTVAQIKDISGKIYWYIPELDQEPLKGVTESLQLMTYSPQNPTGISRHNGAGNCGLMGLLFSGSILRAKEIVMIGMDGGYSLDTPIEQLHYHNGIMKTCGYDEKQVASLYRIYQSTLGTCVVDPVFEVYFQTFKSIASSLQKAGIKIVNCTEGGCLLADGVQARPFKEYLSNSPPSL